MTRRIRLRSIRTGPETLTRFRPVRTKPVEAPRVEDLGDDVAVHDRESRSGEIPTKRWPPEKISWWRKLLRRNKKGG